MLNNTLAAAAERELIDMIYAALLGERPWQGFLDHLNTAIPGGITTLFFHDQRTKGGAVSLSAGLEDSYARDYATYYAGLNPWMRNVAQTPQGRGIVGEAIVTREDFIRSEYYNDFLSRREIEAGVGVTLWREHDCSFLLSSLTSRVDPDENQRIADLFTRLSPHLMRAFRYYRDEPFGGVLARFGSSLLESARVGVVVVGEGREMKAASARAEPFLEAGNPVWVTATGRLKLRDEASDAILAQMLGRDYAGPHSRMGYAGAYRVTLIRTEMDSASGYFGGPSVAVLIEDACIATSELDVTWMVQRFGLTHAETRAVLGIVNGATLTQIAATAGVARETVRAQLKSVYAKTGAGGQAALMKLALSHPATR